MLLFILGLLSMCIEILWWLIILFIKSYWLYKMSIIVKIEKKFVVKKVLWV